MYPPTFWTTALIWFGGVAQISLALYGLISSHTFLKEMVKEAVFL